MRGSDVLRVVVVDIPVHARHTQSPCGNGAHIHPQQLRVHIQILVIPCVTRCMFGIVKIISVRKVVRRRAELAFVKSDRVRVTELFERDCRQQGSWGVRASWRGEGDAWRVPRGAYRAEPTSGMVAMP
jgi:hypothetical protein